MVGFKAPRGCGPLWEQGLEHAPGNPHHAFIFADSDAEFDNRAVGVPASVRRKAEEHGFYLMDADIVKLVEFLSRKHD
jgi:hypothetical protein